MSEHIAYMDNMDFHQRFEDYRRRAFAIKIAEDVTPSVGRVIIAQIDELYSMIRLDYAMLQSERNRVESLIKEIERAESKGKNETERKKNATDAVREFDSGDGQVYNLYKMYQQVSKRYDMLNALVDILDKKQSRLITVSGLLKLDKELGNF